MRRRRKRGPGRPGRSLCGSIESWERSWRNGGPGASGERCSGLDDGDHGLGLALGEDKGKVDLLVQRLGERGDIAAAAFGQEQGAAARQVAQGLAADGDARLFRPIEPEINRVAAVV